MNDNMQLVKAENPATMMRMATDVAGVCKEIVLKTALQIQGRKYVRVEGWTSIALAHGCVASSRDVEKVEGGYKAIGEVKRMSDGMILSTAEGFVGMDETKTWGVRPEYACRAMAQTRAISRACRSAFSHVVVLIDADLSTTPAEEVPPSGFENAKPVKDAMQPQTAPQAKPTPKEQPSSVQSGDNMIAECTLDSFNEKSGKTNNKDWTVHFAKFTDANGQQFDAGTFDKKIAESFEVLQGEKVRLEYRNGKKPGSFEIVSLEPADELPMN